MPEYFLETWGWISRTEFLGKTPNEDGEYPLQDPRYGVMSQQFSVQPDGVLLKLKNLNIIGLFDGQVLLDQTGRGRIRLTSHNALEIDLGEDGYSPDLHKEA